MKKMILTIITFVIALIVLAVTSYAWFTKRDEIPGFSQNTDGLRLEYEITKDTEKLITITDLAFFDYKNDTISDAEYQYFLDMALKYEVTLKNSCDYDFYVNITNNSINEYSPYVGLLVFSNEPDLSLYSSFNDLRNASLENNQISISARTSTNVIFYVFGVVSNEPENNDFLNLSYKLNVLFNVTTNSK